MADVASLPVNSVSGKTSRLALPKKKTNVKSTKVAKSPAAKSGKSTKSATVSTKIPKVQKTSSNSDQPTYLMMVTASLVELKDRKGASNQAIHAFICSKYKLSSNDKMVRTRISTALKKGVSNGSIVQVSGIGARGRFKIAPKVTSTPKAAPSVVPKSVPTTKKAGNTSSKSKSTQATSKTASDKSMKKTRAPSNKSKKAATKSKKSIVKSQKGASNKAIKPKKA